MYVRIIGPSSVLTPTGPPNSKYTCISASFLQIGVIGRMELLISGMLGV
jgi:hypothetical protein